MSILECIDIEHIGSTAIPGPGGKGIIDIGIMVAQKDIGNAARKIESLGYIFRETNGATNGVRPGPVLTKAKRRTEAYEEALLNLSAMILGIELPGKLNC